jgi:hypothetical protein
MCAGHTWSKLVVEQGSSAQTNSSRENVRKAVTMWMQVSVKVEVKLKCTPVQALWLCTGRTAHRGSRGIALLFNDHGTRRG